MSDTLDMENSLDNIEEANVEMLKVLKEIRDMMKVKFEPVVYPMHKVDPEIARALPAVIDKVLFQKDLPHKSISPEDFNSYKK